jgi:hypothetical protein
LAKRGERTLLDCQTEAWVLGRITSQYRSISSGRLRKATPDLVLLSQLTVLAAAAVVTGERGRLAIFFLLARNA